MRIIVTGSAGFIGRHACDLLMARGHAVMALDRLALVGLAPTPESQGGHDILHLAPLYISGWDAVVHLAGRAGTGQSWTQFRDYWVDNVAATHKLLQLMKEAGIKRLVHVSSSSVYGCIADGDEDMPKEPVSPYGITKLAGEQLARCMSQQYGIGLTVIRPFTVYGPGQRPDMYQHIFIKALLEGSPITIDSDGEQARSCTYVGDVARALALAVEKPEAIGHAFNIGGEGVVSVNQIIALLEEIIGVKAQTSHGPKRPGDQDRTVANTVRAGRVLGWRPEVGLKEGLRRQVEWQRGESNG